MSPVRPLITVTGSLNIDFVTTTPRCPQPGETLSATSLTVNAGGKGANQAVACGRAAFTTSKVQDVDVEMVGAVGQDDVYVQKLLMPTLEASGVGTHGIQELEMSQTGTASIVVESTTGENRIMLVGGANITGMDNIEDVQSRIVATGREPDVLVLQGEIPRSTTLGLLSKYNHNERTQIVFNPAPVFPEGIPGSFFDGLEVLVINESETILLGKSLAADGFDLHGVSAEKDLTGERVLHELATEFQTKFGVRIVLITLGSKGTFWSSSMTKGYGLVPAIKVDKVVDTTAAGDTFVGYFAVSMARHHAVNNADTFDIANAVTEANWAAAKCVQKAGAMQSIPYGYE